MTENRFMLSTLSPSIGSRRNWRGPGAVRNRSVTNSTKPDTRLRIPWDGAGGSYEKRAQTWAPRVAAIARLLAGHPVLDVACGTGVLAPEAAG